MPLFNPKNEQERQREAIIQERNRMIIERRAIPALSKEFNRVAVEASQSDPDLPRIISQHQRNIDQILRQVYQATIMGVAKRVVEEAPKSAFIKIEKKDLEGEIGKLITQWIFGNAMIESMEIASTTQAAIAGAILNNVGAGEKIVGQAIRNAVGGSIGKSRSLTIARTETHDASQSAQLDMVEKMDFPPDSKEWVSIKDSRTRDDHIKADNQTVLLDDYFDIGGKKMKRPGDRRGGAAQTINCRCVMIFVDNI